MSLKNDPAPYAGKSKQTVTAMDAGRAAVAAMFPGSTVLLDATPRNGVSTWQVGTADLDPFTVTYNSRSKKVS